MMYIIDMKDNAGTKEFRSKAKEFIIKAPNNTKEDEEIPKILFQVPFRIAVVAPSNSGKSVLISNLISNPELPYRKLFKKNIFIWSSTFHLDDPSFSMSDNIIKTNVFNEYDENSVMSIVDEQIGIIKKYTKKKAPPILFIFDDVIQDLPMTKQNVMNKLFFSARHYNISLILLSQQYKMVPRSVRLNASDVIIFQTGNNAEITKIAEEQAIDINKFKEILKHATSEPYSFLVIHNKLPLSQRYQLRLSYDIYEIE
jgi:GTPase SAR1 family protein